MASRIPEEPLPWASVSDLSEYAFCPRAHWYRQHPPAEPVDPASVRSARSGEEFHRRALSGVRRREERGAALALLAIAAAVALLIALYLTGAVG